MRDNNIIKSCKDCELGDICPDAHSDISQHCNMMGQVKSMRAVIAVKQAKIILQRNNKTESRENKHK